MLAVDCAHAAGDCEGLSAYSRDVVGYIEVSGTIDGSKF
jgi:hypothetical protein